MTALIRDQVERYSEASCKVQHDRAMQCRDLDNWLAFGLSILSGIRRIDAQYRESLRAGKAALDRQLFQSIQSLYELWLRPGEHLLNSIESFEREGFTFDNAAEFRSACRDRAVTGFDVEALSSALEEFRTGRPGRPLSEAMDAVRRRAGREG